MSGILKIFSSISSGKAAKQQRQLAQQKADTEKEARRVDQIRQDVLTKKEKIKQQRDSRAAGAQIRAKAVNAGVGQQGTSGLSGAESSVKAQASENVGTLGQFRGFGERLSALSQKSADFSTAIGQSQYKLQQKMAMFDTIGAGISIVGRMAKSDSEMM